MKTKRLFKSITAIVLVFVLAFAPVGDIPFLRDFAITASAAEVVASGACGATSSDNVTWTFYNDGTLTISGSGEMKKYDYVTTSSGSTNIRKTPWYLAGYNITKIVIEDGVKKISDGAFNSEGINNYKSVKSVTFNGDGLTVGTYAFANCTSLETITITNYDCFTGVYNYAFGYCNNIKTIYYGGTKTQWDTIISKFNDSSNTYFKSNGNGYFTGASVNASGATVTVYCKRNITFNANGTGGSVSSTSQYTDMYGKLSSPLPTASRSGYKFLGWYTAASGGDEVTTSTVFTSDTTVYAHWELDTCIVTYNANGGSVSPASKTINCGNAINPLPTASRTGYNFDGWYTAQNGGKMITNATTFSSDTTIWAHWNANTYTVTFNENYGSNSTSSKTVTYDSNYILPTAPTRTGYTFAGWYTAASGGTQVTDSTKVQITAAQTLYAHWTINSYTVTYNYSQNGGTSATTTTANVDYNSPIDLTPTATKDGWEFVGWNTNKDATTGLTSLTMGTAQITLYAIYKKTLTATFYSGSGCGTQTKSVTIYNRATSGNVTAPELTAWDGYTALGWNSSATGYTKEKAANDSIAISGDTNYYGVYSKEVTLSYHAGDGTGTVPASQTATRYANVHSSVTYSGGEITLASGAGLSRTGYTFAGWKTNTTGTVVKQPGDTVQFSADDTCYAQWTINSYTVTYDYATNGGISATKTTANVNYNSSIDLTPTATKTGWTFVGWNTNKDATTGLTSLTMGTDKITLYAIYKKTLTATFYSGSGCGTQTKSVTIYNNATSGNVTAPTLTAWEGYTALGWNSSVSDYTKEKAANDSITISADKDYYGVYSREVTLTYDANGGTGTLPASQTAISYANVHSEITYYGGEITLAKGTGLSRAGYTFAGWKTSATGTTVKQPDDTVQFIADCTYYVNWAANTYTVIYNGNGSTGGSMGNSTHTYDTAQALTANGFEKKYTVTFNHNYSGSTNEQKTAAYEFAGWGISETGTEIKYGNGASVKNLTAEKNGTFHLYARWTPVSVSYIPIRSCYTFEGWYEDSGCSGTRVDADGTYTPTGNITLYARWTENRITGITHEPYDGIYDLADHSIEVRGTLSGDKIEYSTDGTTYASPKPTFTEVGTYTVYYRVTRDNYFDYTDSATVTISQKALSSSDITVEGIEDKDYTGGEITQVITLKYGDVVIPSSEYVVAYSDNIAAGEVIVTITNNPGGNYTLTDTITVSFIIKKIEITGIAFGDYTGIYDGGEHSITVTGTVDGGKIEYLTDGTDYSGTNPAFKDAGTYTVHYKVTKDNYIDLTGTATVKISQKDVTILGVKAEDKTYDGRTEGTATGTPKIPELVASDKNKVSVSVGTATFEDKNVGTNKTVTFAGFTLTGEKAGNYHLSAQPESVTASISKAPVAIVWKEEAFTYNGNPQKPGLDSVAGIVDGDDCSVTVSGEETNATKAGLHCTATASLVGGDKDNYYILSGETENFTIARKELAVEMIALDGEDDAYPFTGSPIAPVVTVSDGTAMTEEDYTIGGKTSATDVGSYDLTVTGKENYTGKVTVTWQISDPNAPTGSITVSANSWDSFSDTTTFGLFFQKTQTVTITGRDGAGESGVDKLYYYLSGTEFASESELALVTGWTELSAKGTAEKKGSFSVNPDQKLIIYAKITDKSGNAAYLNSNGIILDATAPVIEGVTDGMVYCAAQTVTISDDNLDKVTVNGSGVTLAQGKYTLAADGTKYTVVASDKAGNDTTVTVTVNNGHTAGEAEEENRIEASCTEEGSYDTAVYCTICHEEMSRETNAIEAAGHSFGKWKKVKSPNCTDKGSKKRSCTVCGYTETEDVDAAGHSWADDYTTDKEATCTEDGSRSIHCSECDAVKDSAVIPATGHDFGGAWCKDADGQWKECSHCGERGQAGSHTYDDAADAVCNDCGYIRTVDVPGKDHPGNIAPSDDEGKQEGDGDQRQPGKQEGNADQRQPENDDKQLDPAEKDGEILVITGEKVTTGNVPEAEGEETTIDVGKGKVIVTVVCEDEDYTAGVADTVAVANAVLTPEQIRRTNNGETVEIRVVVEDISGHVPASEKEAVEKCIEQQNEIPGLQLGMYIDISMYIRIGSGDWDPVTQTREAIDVVIGIPEELQEEGRDYYIVRSHEGGITLLYDMDHAEDTITIRTEQFSTYAIAYTQAAVETVMETTIETTVGADGLIPHKDKRCGLCHICPTFLGVCCFIWLASIVIVLAALGVIWVMRGRHRSYR